MEKLIVFDLDGTIVEWTESYRRIYSGSLEKVVEKERGKLGLKVLQYCRENLGGKGELALFLLNIPFREWAKELMNMLLDGISPQPALVKTLRKLEMKKIIYTGSPLKFAIKVLERVGFSKDDFDFILGWEEPEIFPIKWSCSPVVFKYILEKFSVSPEDAWSVGDIWETDLMPAQKIGMKTAKIGKYEGHPTVCFATLEQFLDYLRGEGSE